MTENEVRRMAVRLLADYDAKTPREQCFRPTGLTIPLSAGRSTAPYLHN